MFTDVYGLHKKDKWYGRTNRQFQRWFHHCWKQSGDPNADKDEIEEAYAEWIRRGSPENGRCDGTPPPAVTVAAPDTSGGETSCDTCERSIVTIVIGGIVYTILSTCTGGILN